MSNKIAWTISLLVTVILLIVLVKLWSDLNGYEDRSMFRETQDHSAQLANSTIVKNYLDDRIKNDALDEPLEVRTGIFIQSLDFFNSNEVSLTGYVWQHYDEVILDSLTATDSTRLHHNRGLIRYEQGEIGIIFPEQVNSNSGVEPQEVYRKTSGGEVVIGWYFEATLRQPFDYSKYPFDHQQVWVRMWPKNFLSNVVLVPDLKGYEETETDSIFGREKSLVMGSWELNNSYFNYRGSTYDTNFGLHSVNQNSDVRKDIIAFNIPYPELHYNFLLKRKFENAFIFYLLPIILIASLLFAGMLTIGVKESFREQVGFSAFNFITASSAIFFVLMLAHIQLRGQFEGTDIVFLEYIYILMYVFIVLATCNAYLFSIRSSFLKDMITRRENLLPKLLYWPFFIGSLIIITIVVFIEELMTRYSWDVLI